MAKAFTIRELVEAVCSARFAELAQEEFTDDVCFDVSGDVPTVNVDRIVATGIQVAARVLGVEDELLAVTAARRTAREASQI